MGGVPAGFLVKDHGAQVEELVHELEDVVQFVLYFGGSLSIVLLLLLFSSDALLVEQEVFVDAQECLEGMVGGSAVHERARLLVGGELHQQDGVPVELLDFVKLGLV